VDATALAALLTRIRLAIFQTLGAGIRSGDAVWAENGVLKISFSMQNYIDVRFMAAGVRQGWPTSVGGSFRDIILQRGPQHRFLQDSAEPRPPYSLCPPDSPPLACAHIAVVTCACGALQAVETP
jgi:hypothetical protein